MGALIFASAKDAPLTAVILFDSPQGASYVQVTGVTVNGKTEVRLCDGISKFNKSAYNALPRAPLKGATSLQRGSDGVLSLTINGKAICAVPNGLRFDQQPELTPAEAAEQAVIQGTPISPSAAIPALKPGVQLVFVDAADVELAEFLRAQRANTIKDWEDFLERYPSSSHLAVAKNTLAGLYQQAAESAFAQYQKSSQMGKQDLAMLQQAYREAEAASGASPGYQPASQLLDAIGRELDNLQQADRARLQAFLKAIQEHTPGYSQLAVARSHVNQLLQVRSDYMPLLNLRREIAAEQRKLETTIATAESLTASGRYDEAVNSLGPYVSFASEVPAVEGVLRAAYRYHFDAGQQATGRDDWEQAVGEFRKAAVLRPENKQAEALLNNATTQLSAQRDQKAANLALLESNDYAAKSEFIEAYNVLADLPEKQRSLVASQLTNLAQRYVDAAPRRAQKLQETHLPIRGRADEDAVREAFVLLDRASSLSGNPAITLKRDFLSSKISTYYLEQADRYLKKPSGAGAGVGWLYLQEAQRFGITNLDTVNDQMARYRSLYQRRAHLSLGIAVRDQTSQRDNPAFADQLAAAVANGLEASGVTVDLVRQPSETGDALQPNLILVGEILEHRVVKNVSLESPLSKYRVGAQETKNPAWLQAESEYESAQQQLDSAQQALADAQSHKKKDAIAAANDQVQEDQKRVDELRQKLASIDQNRVEAVVAPYHYTKESVELNASIELEFHITDPSGKLTDQPFNVRKSDHKVVVLLRDVKPEDTEGVTNQGTEPDETQFLTDLEIEARNAIVKAVRQTAEELPAKVLQEARTSVQQGDLDGAAEQYIMYLNATAEAATPERNEAAQFLHDRFNLAPPTTSKP
jgi:hypothetical protein